MTAGEWEKIKTLFDTALQQPPEERRDWLQGACAEQPELLQTVWQLIQDYEESPQADARSDEAPPVFAAGDLIANRFLIGRLLAHGGMGEVYEATDSNLRGIKVALKTLRPGIASEQQAIERFKREVWVAREISHPGICRVFDHVEHKIARPDGTEATIPCLTMSLLDGESLAAHMSQRRPLSPKAALPIIRQLTECVQALHDSDVVHRDIKPSNIMLVPVPGGVPQVVLIDFGLAKPFNSRSEAWETKTQMQAGAPYFISPEALRGETTGPRADLYALGLVIDDMVTTRPAYQYSSIEELFWRKLHGRPEGPSERSTGLPLAWERVILRCLERDPARRPKSALEVFRELEDCGQSKVPETILRAMDGLKRRSWMGDPFLPHSRRKWITAGLIGVAAAACVGAYSEQLSELSTSIVVLPFENLTSHQGAYEAICLGTSEELIRRLNYVKGLNVLEAPRKWNPDEPALKGIRFMLQGKLKDDGGTPELFVSLIDRKATHVVWTETYKHELAEPLQLESLLTNKAIEEMRRNLAAGDSIWRQTTYNLLPRLRPGNAEGLPAQGTTSNEAAAEYQRGRKLWAGRSLSGALEAEKAYQAAIGIDANYALAYAALADVQHTLLTYSYDSNRKLMSRAVDYADKAVSIDSSLPECHVARAAAKQNLWAWEESEASYLTAIERQPKLPRAHHWYAGLLLQFGKFEAALARAQLGLDLATFDFAAFSTHGLYLWYADRPKDAITKLELVVKKSDLFFAHVVLAQVYAHLATQPREPNATHYYTRSIEHAVLAGVKELEETGTPAFEPPFLKWSDMVMVQAHAARGDVDAAETYMERLRQGFYGGKIPGTILAWGYAALKQWDRTLEMLNHGLANQEREMLYVKVYPLLKPLHRDPAFTAILKEMRLA